MPSDGLYEKVLDGRKQPIRGLWRRNGEFYAQVRVPGRKSPVKTRLIVLNLDAAKKALEKIRVQRREGSLASLKRSPKLTDWVAEYFDHIDKLQSKRPASVRSEHSHLNAWIKALGHVRISDLTVKEVEQFIENRKAAGLSGRTCDLDIIALNSVLKYARKLRIIDRQLPTAFYEPMAEEPKERPLWTHQQIELVCQAARDHSANGEQFGDYIWFLAYSGMRRDEALRRRWDEVHWDRRYITLDRLSKGKYARKVDFNQSLESHLKGLYVKRAPDTAFLFPSPLRGDTDRPANSFRGTLDLARQKAAERDPALADFQLHDLRHYFISTCVMAGVEFLTIARWVGHKDGGILIGRVYGHLADEHMKRMAAKVIFVPRVVQLEMDEVSTGQVAQLVAQPSGDD